MRHEVTTLFVAFLFKSSSVINWLQNHLLTCPFKKIFSIDCPGCGIQRSVLALLKGNFVESIKLYPATIPIISLLILVVVHLKLDFKYGALFIKILYIGIAIIIVINYIYKILSNHLL